MPKSAIIKYLVLINCLMILSFSVAFSLPDRVLATEPKTIKITQDNLPSAPEIDYIAINNEVIEIGGYSGVHVELDDAVKIAGQAKPGTKITIIFADRSLETVTDENGNWFVLFSVLNMEAGIYQIEAQYQKETMLSSAGTSVDEVETINLSTISLGDDFKDTTQRLDLETAMDKQTVHDITPPQEVNKNTITQLLKYLFIIVFSAVLVVGTIIFVKNKELQAKILHQITSLKSKKNDSTADTKKEKKVEKSIKIDQ